MRVSEAVKRWADVLGKEIEIEGIAEVSNSFSVIYEEEERIKREIGNSITTGILVHGDQLQTIVESLPKPISALAGSDQRFLTCLKWVFLVLSPILDIPLQLLN